MYPRLLINTEKFRSNVLWLKDLCESRGIKIAAVTKVFCADEVLVKILVDSGVSYLADSRIGNLKKLADLDIEKILLRLPSISQARDVVKYSDISLNSELATMRALSLAAKEEGRVHKVVLMLELGDLREGILLENFDYTVSEILKLDGIALVGVGVNLTCYGTIIPSEEKMELLSSFASRLEEEYALDLEIISGGNSSSLNLLLDDKMPEKINNLRFGESIALGKETATCKLVDGLFPDVFTLEAEIIEKKVKPSVPDGERGRDAFGNEQDFEDRGDILRVILSVGRQDVNIDSLVPSDKNAKILGASSDHLIVDISDCEAGYEIGDIMSFDLNYETLLGLATSPYVEKYYI